MMSKPLPKVIVLRVPDKRGSEELLDEMRTRLGTEYWFKGSCHMTLSEGVDMADSARLLDLEAMKRDVVVSSKMPSCVNTGYNAALREIAGENPT